MLVIALTKHEPGVGTSYVVVGTLAEETANELVLSKAISPIINAKNEIQFQQHIVPNEFVNPEYLENVKVVLSKGFLAFYVVLNEEDPHPISDKYKKFWNLEPEIVNEA